MKLLWGLQATGDKIGTVPSIYHDHPAWLSKRSASAAVQEPGAKLAAALRQVGAGHGAARAGR